MWAKIKSAAKWIGIVLATLLTLGGYLRGRADGHEDADDEQQEAIEDAKKKEVDMQAAFEAEVRAIYDRYPVACVDRLRALAAISRRYRTQARNDEASRR
jgi:hypothetical protein